MTANHDHHGAAASEPVAREAILTGKTNDEALAIVKKKFLRVATSTASISLVQIKVEEGTW